MSWDSSPTPPLRGRLARHLGRLQQSLDGVGEQVRQAVASAVGRTMAEAVGEAVYEALRPRDGSIYPQPRSSSWYSDRSATSRREWDEPAWRREADASSWRDPYGYDDYDVPRYDDDPELDNTSSPHDQVRARRWGHAVSAGLQAVAWWLRGHPGQVSLLAALTVGAVAGLTVLAGHASGIAGLVASALGLAYLLDLVRSASTLLGRSSTP
jgi:hypothetical protein